MSVLTDHLKLVCSPVCFLLFLSCGLLFSLSLALLLTLFLSPLLASHQWFCNERCVWRRGDETLPGGGLSGVPGESSVNCVCVCLHVGGRPFDVLTCIALAEKRSHSISHTRTLRLSFSCWILPQLSINWCYQLPWLLASIVCVCISTSLNPQVAMGHLAPAWD